MAKNWLWWTLGSVAVLGLGVGVYMFSRKKDEEIAPVETPNAPSQPSTPPAHSSGGSAGGVNPFSSENDVRAFQHWANTTQGKNLTEDGKFGPKTLAAWLELKSKYNQSSSSGQTPASTGQLAAIQVAMGNVKINVNDGTRLQYVIYDGSGYRNILANFMYNGQFWIESESDSVFSHSNGVKLPGTWSESNGSFTITLADGSYSATGTNLKSMLLDLAKKKFPSMVPSGFQNAAGDNFKNARRESPDHTDALK